MQHTLIFELENVIKWWKKYAKKIRKMIKLESEKNLEIWNEENMNKIDIM